MGESKTPATRPNPIDILRRIDSDMSVILAKPRKQALILEILEHGEFQTATAIEKRVMLLDPDFIYVFGELKRSEAEMALLTDGNKKLIEDLKSADDSKFNAAYDRLKRRAEQHPLVNISINNNSGTSSEEIMEALAKKNGNGSSGH